MRRSIQLLMVVALVAACSKEEAKPAADSTSMAPAAPAPITLTDVAGTWTMQLGPAGQDTTLLTYQLIATADTTGWSIIFPDRTDPVPMRILHVAGDSIVAEAGPYTSALRPGVPVSVSLVSRLRGDRMISNVVAHYATTAADSVVQLRARGTRGQ